MKYRVLDMAISRALAPYSRGIIGPKWVAEYLGITRYRASKLLNELVEEGLIEKKMYKGYWMDDGETPVPPLRGYRITEECKKTERYKEAYKNHMFEYDFLPF